MKAAIIGASGYSGEELIKLLAHHPNVELAAVTSRSLVGKKVADSMPMMRHSIGDLRFTDSDPQQLAQNTSIDLFFLA